MRAPPSNRSSSNWFVVAGLLAVAAAVAYLWYGWCWFPLYEWNEMRLAPAFALRHGVTLYPALDASRRAAALPRRIWVRIDSEHRDIIAAIAAGNATAAEAAARRHLAHLRAALDDAESAVALAGDNVSVPTVAW